MVQEIAPGKSLFQLVESGWRTNEREIKDIAQQILSILSYLHSLDPPVIHRDIKPNNLIRDDEGKIYLVDFGAVQNTYYNTLMQGSTVVGTYGYMSPEQFSGKALPQSDLYSLGATLLYLLTHRSPAELPQDTLKLDFRNSVDISGSFADWLEKILEPDIEDRFSNADVALVELFKSKRNKRRKLATNIAAGILAMSLIAGVDSYKWFFLSRFGYIPNNLCLNRKTMQSYLQRGGKVNISIYFAKNQKQFLSNCAMRLAYIDVFSEVKHLNYHDKERFIRFLLSKNVDIEGKDDFNNTPLLNAADLGDLDTVKILIKHGADVDAINNDYDTPLHKAVNLKSQTMAKLLIDSNANLNIKDKFGNTPLNIAVSRRSFKTVEVLTKNGANVNLKNSKGITALHNAVNGKSVNIIKLLINNGAEIDIQNENGETPLFNAACQLNKGIVQVLIDAGANPDHRNNNGQTPLFCAAKRSYYISRNYDVEIFKKLIDAGADINLKDNQGQTPLFNAAHFSHIKVVQFLIDNGADVNAISNDGTTPIFHTIRDNTAQLLINNGANVNAQNIKGETPLFRAWHEDLVEILIKNGADVNTKDREGKTPLSDAIIDMTETDRHVDNLTLLINHGANPHNIDYETMKSLYDLDLTTYKSKKVKSLLKRIKNEKAK